MRRRPRFSTRTRLACWRTRRWRVVVGQRHAKRAAISPALMLPPRKFKTIRISRRSGCARALKSAAVWRPEVSRSDLGKAHPDRLDVREFHLGPSQTLFHVNSHSFPYLHHGGICMGFLCAADLPRKDFHEESLLGFIHAAVYERGFSRHKALALEGGPVPRELLQKRRFATLLDAVSADHHFGFCASGKAACHFKGSFRLLLLLS